MDRETRTAIESATQNARTLLQDDFRAQLKADFDIGVDEAIPTKGGGHLTPKRALQRERVVAAIEHKRATGMTAAAAIDDYIRDAAFTTLNRFVALKMLEARELVQQCITKGEQSSGYDREFCGLAPGLSLLPKSEGYRLYIECLFDELSTDVKVLFDRRDPSSVLWPSRTTFEKLLGHLNAPALASVWGEDETIGWVYQFFNDGEERKKMRDPKQGGSQAPRNSRELAIRNQFFTPRYVVEFLTDNTLGRIWYEMRATETALAERCAYLVRKPGETFAPRAQKDPRDLRVLDPACGSGHFLLYAFDLLVVIYEEAHGDPESPKSEATGRTLAEDYPMLDALRRALPGLILAHNLHGVDIDARCAQIAQLALWMRAQRAYREFGIGRADRPTIRRSNIVVAEPLIADDQLAKEFVARLGDPELGDVFTALVEALKLAGELGLLLTIEKLVAPPRRRGQTGDLFAPPEERIRATLTRFLADEETRASMRRRLFAEDAAQGVGLLAIAEKKFDVVVMNPPFGEPVRKLPPEYKGLPKDLYCCFVERASVLLSAGGRVGAITSASFRTYVDYESFRTRFFTTGLSHVVVDLGWGVLDGAYVETAAYVLTRPDTKHDETLFLDLRDEQKKEGALLVSLRRVDQTPNAYWRKPGRFAAIAGAPLLYRWGDTLFEAVARAQRVGGLCEAIGKGAGPHALFYRLRWEVSPADIGLDRRWAPFSNGGTFSPFFRDDVLLLHWESAGKLVKAYLLERYPYLDGNTEWNIQMEEHYGRPGLTYGKKTTSFSAQVMPAGRIFSFEGMGVFPRSAEDSWWLLAYLNSDFVRRYLNATCGLHKNPPYVRNVPVPRFADNAVVRLDSLAKQGWTIQWIRAEHDERTSMFVAPWTSQEAVVQNERALHDVLGEIDQLVRSSVGLTQADLLALDESDAASDDSEPEDDDVAAARETTDLRDAWHSWAVGVAFGRFDLEAERVLRERPADLIPSATHAFDGYNRAWPKDVAAIRVDDEGHEHDLEPRVVSALFHGGRDAVAGVRDFLAHHFFASHIKCYSKYRRKAPIYWQLATPSARYSVWLYIHAFTNDTLFRVQNDYIARKLEIEEGRLETIRREGAKRKEVAAQEAFVVELRTFLDEVKRVAPLWKPNLDDGVIINFAPLWRLVPQHKAWQKELKATWDTLCEGKYDWAHLAMHLWPERVVPKCATDRSLAIAHGLEEVFWVEGSDGKWTPRKTPTRGLDELVRERSSPAVQAARDSLRNAPVPSGGGGKRSKRGGGDA